MLAPLIDTELGTMRQQAPAGITRCRRRLSAEYLSAGEFAGEFDVDNLSHLMDIAADLNFSLYEPLPGKNDQLLSAPRAARVIIGR